jgi:hypothetical protein
LAGIIDRKNWSDRRIFQGEGTWIWDGRTKYLCGINDQFSLTANSHVASLCPEPTGVAVSAKNVFWVPGVKCHPPVQGRGMQAQELRPSRDSLGHGLALLSPSGLLAPGAAANRLAEMTGARLTPWQLRDLRRTIDTVMGNALGVLPHIADHILGHVGPHRSGVQGIYNRADYWPQCVEAMALWGEHLRAIVEGRTPKVIPLRAQRA